MKVGDLIRGTNGLGLGLIIKILHRPAGASVVYKVQFLKDGEWRLLTDAWLEVVNESR